MASSYFPVHAHSDKSVLDGIGTVEDMVARAVHLNQPALALTDHGHMGGTIRLYLEAKKHDLVPFPGSEFYLVNSVDDEEGREQRYHLTMVALDQIGFEAMIKLSSRSHQRDRFHRKPLIDFGDLAAMAEEGVTDHIAITTSCYFGLVVQTLVKNGMPAAINATKMLQKWFPNTLFVELQNHGIKHDDPDDKLHLHDHDIVKSLMRIANLLSLPVVVGQDSHYVCPTHKGAHDMMKEIGYHGGDPDDFKFPGDSFHMGTTSWISRHFTMRQWEAAEEGHDHLLGLNRLRLPELDKYKFHVPAMSKDPKTKLDRLTKRGIHKRGMDTYHHYHQRVKYELKVINQMGFANYFIMMEDLLGWARRKGIFFNVRGSANGSLVCYALGITEVDPIQWDLSFDRFLSLDRQKPPDIDVDIESSRRGEFIGYARSRFPTLVHIGTYGRLGITQSEDEGIPESEDKGSVFVKYMAAKRRTEGKNFDGKVAKKDRPALQALSDLEPRQSLGVHAGGLVFPGHDLPIDKYLATALVPSSGITVTQAPMDDVEDAGYVKGDFLGLRSLETLRRCVEAIGRDPVVEGLAWIPIDDPKACKTLSEGRPLNGIFQFEGYSTAKGARQMKIKSTLDAMYCLALFRPALMNGGQTERFLRNRKKKHTEKIHPIIDRHLDATFGVPVFQEQVLGVMKAVDLPYQDQNDILKAVKASNTNIAHAGEVFARVKKVFIGKAVEAGLTAQEARRAWAHVEGFDEYGFNKAHATGYGMMSYRMAYLKTYYPTEYMVALLATWSGTKKEPVYLKEARRMGITIGRPNVNKSDVLWRAEGTIARKGLLSIKGVGEAAAEAIASERHANGPYSSVDDMLRRLPARPVSRGKDYERSGNPDDLVGVMKALLDAGALKTIL